MAEQKIIVDNKAVAIEDTKTVFGLGQLNNQTPVWAKNVLKLTILVTSVAAIWINGTSLIDPAIKDELNQALGALDLLVLGVSRLFGVEAK